MIRCPWGQVWVCSQDTRVNTATLTISAIRLLVTTESQDTLLTLHLKDGTLHRVMSPITALGHWDLFSGQRKEFLLLALQHHFQQHLVSHPWQTLLSFSGKPAVGCSVDVCMCISVLRAYVCVTLPQSSCDPVGNHSEAISHTVSVPLQTTLGTLEEIACWVPSLAPHTHQARPLWATTTRGASEQQSLPQATRTEW